jgi:hypothetical protein
MTAKKRISDLQQSYRGLVEAIEEYVVKEGKTLQQAFEAAEHQLINAAETSKEKIMQASSDLKNNLGVLGEAIEGASEAYKENIKFDVAYINASAWDKLQSIANSNTVELMAFTRNLKEAANEATTQEHLTVHQQHNDWVSDHEFWLDEVEFWQKDHAMALSKLVLIEQAIKEQTNVLKQHVAAIQNHEEQEHQHETAMANVEQDQISDVYKEADKQNELAHKKAQLSHEEQAEIHRKLKTSHLKLMTMINTLYKETHKNS